MPNDEWELSLNLELNSWEDSDLFESLSLGDDWWMKLDMDPLVPESWSYSDDDEGLCGSRSGPEIRIHDCMWAGTCLSKDHVGRPNRQIMKPCPSNPKIVAKHTKMVCKVHPDRPDTPQSLSESEDDRDTYTVSVAVSEVTNQRRIATSNHTSLAVRTNNARMDHNYDSKHPRLDDLGVQTPSDSEEEEEEEEEDVSSEDEDEEIDVVNVKPAGISSVVTAGESSIKKRLKTMLPTSLVEEVKEEEEDEEEEDELGEYEEECRIMRWATSLNSAVALEADSRKQLSSKVSSNTKGRRGKRKRASSEDDATYTPNQPLTRVGSRPKRPAGSKRPKTATDSETDSTEKRSLHNSMERIRRIDLRNAFNDLRTLLPSLTDSRRASKVTILREAAAYCSQLTCNSRTLSSQVAILRKEQDKLRSNLSRQRRLFASTHLPRLTS